MSVSMQDVIDCYRFILGREPENDLAIKSHMWHRDLLECCRAFYERKKQLEKADQIIITSHIHPDGDAIGSCLALYHVLKL